MTEIVSALYFVTGVFAACASLKSRIKSDARRWGIISVGVIAFGIFHVAEAGLWISVYLQRALHALDWYDERRRIQAICIAAVAIGLLIAIRNLAKQIPTLSLRIAAGSFCLLTLFSAVRSSSLHWTDIAFRWRLGPLTVSHLTQLALLIAIFSAASSRLISRSKSKMQSLRGAIRSNLKPSLHSEDAH